MTDAVAVVPDVAGLPITTQNPSPGTAEKVFEYVSVSVCARLVRVPSSAPARLLWTPAEYESPGTEARSSNGTIVWY